MFEIHVLSLQIFPPTAQNSVFNQRLLSRGGELFLFFTSSGNVNSSKSRDSGNNDLSHNLNICHTELSNVWILSVFLSPNATGNINDEAMTFETTAPVQFTSETSSLVSLVKVALLRLQACFILFVLPFCLKLFQSTDSKVQSLTCNLE